MAEKDFIVKNGIVVNTAFTANSTQVKLGSNVTVNTSAVIVGATTINSTAVVSSNLSGNLVATTVASANVNTNTLITNTGTYNVSWSVGANVVGNTTTLAVGANAFINSTAHFVGNSTSNAYLTSAGLYVNGTIFVGGGGGYYKGSNGTVGNTNNINNLFRINGNLLSASITFNAGENASAVGPITIGSGNTMVISTGARVVII